MPNPFPELLFLGPHFGPMIIRLAAAGVLLFVAYSVWKNRERIAETSFPIIGKAPWLAAASAVVHGTLGFMLGAGYYTQIAALVAILGSIKSFIFAKRYPSIIPLSRPAIVLLIAILLSLFISGAGAFAFDLPL